jgi:predicted PurR-regulated permease PerM
MIQNNRLNLLFWLYWTSILAFSVVIAFALWHQLKLIIISLVLAFLINPLADKLENKKIPRAVTCIAFFVLGGFSLWFAASELIPIAQNQWESLYSHRNEYQATLEWVDEGTLWLKNSFQEVQTHLPMYATSVLAFIGSTLFAPVFAFFLVTDRKRIRRHILGTIPKDYLYLFLTLQNNFQRQLGAYLRGQIIDCVLVGILVGIGLSFLDVKGAWMIALFAGCANAIPYLGPILGAIPAIAVLLFDPSATSAWWSPILLFAGIKILDDILIYPQTVGKSLHLHPFVVLFAILAGESLAGIIGMLLAVPMVAIITQSIQILKQSLNKQRKHTPSPL